MSYKVIDVGLRKDNFHDSLSRSHLDKDFLRELTPVVSVAESKLPTSSSCILLKSKAESLSRLDL